MGNGRVGWYRQEMQEKAAATRAYQETELAKGRGYVEIEGDPEYLKLRLTEALYRSYWIQETARRDAFLARSGSEKRLGKLYGKASERIYSLRQQLQALDAKWSRTIGQCTCGAWRKAYNEARGNDLDDLRTQLASEREANRLLRERLYGKPGAR